MSNIIVDTGIIPIKYVQEACKATKYTVYFIEDEIWRKKTEKNWPDFRNYTLKQYEEFYTVPNSNKIKNLSFYYNSIYNSVLCDYRTMQLFERCVIRLRPWQNNFNDLIQLDNLIVNQIDWLLEIKPKFVFYHSTPHEPCSWVLAKVAEAMEIPVYMSKTTPLPWKSFLIKGLDEHLIVSCNYGSENGVNGKLVEKYYEINSMKYDEAIPSYEKKRIEARKGKIWSWKKELKETLHRPHRLFTLLRKYSLYKCYQSLAKNVIEKGDYIIVFLHYQPERTSLPEGQFFVQQFHLIQTLHLACPDVKIYVKEHPSIFVGQFDMRYRNKVFYKGIAKMDNVELVDIGIDSFTLLDHSLCIATITGTVGIQALIRGKAVLCFGTGSYRGMEGCYSIKTCDDVKKAVEVIKSKTNNKSYNLAQITLNRLHELDYNSISGVSKEEVNDFYAQNYRLEADGKVMRYVLTKM